LKRQLREGKEEKKGGYRTLITRRERKTSLPFMRKKSLPALKKKKREGKRENAKGNSVSRGEWGGEKKGRKSASGPQLFVGGELPRL